jgi:hypothetical protein
VETGDGTGKAMINDASMERCNLCTRSCIHTKGFPGLAKIAEIQLNGNRGLSALPTGAEPRRSMSATWTDKQWEKVTSTSEWKEDIVLFSNVCKELGTARVFAPAGVPLLLGEAAVVEGGGEEEEEGGEEAAGEREVDYRTEYDERTFIGMGQEELDATLMNRVDDHFEFASRHVMV